LARDLSVYPDDPIRFYPERFLNDDLDKPLEGHWSFGLGRRGGQCIGLANYSMRRLSSSLEEPLDFHCQADLLFRRRVQRGIRLLVPVVADLRMQKQEVLTLLKQNLCSYTRIQYHSLLRLPQEPQPMLG
jgi:hypothetical protein